jgi:C_GCAxxG_C_C family probable redox protein
MAMGDSGCVCGALSGGVLAIGLFSGNRGAHRLRGESRRLARELHDLFKAHCGSTCCRVLTHKVKDDPPAHRQHCADVTGWAASMTARLLIDRFPIFLQQADAGYLEKKESRIGGLVRTLWRRIRA